MEVYEAIQKRRTIRVFKEKANQAQIVRLLHAGAQAPSAANGQSWEFIVVEDQGLVDKLAAIKYNMNRAFLPGPDQTEADVEKAARMQQKAFANANVVAVCSGSEKVADGWLAVENILLAAVADGLGAGIIALRNDAQQQAEKLLKIPLEKQLVCLLKIGVPGEKPGDKSLRPQESWLHKNTFSPKQK